MFDWLKQQVESVVQARQDRRIKAAFPAYERQQRELHIANAKRRFSVTDLENEVARLMHPARTLANQHYGKPIAVLRSELPVAWGEISELECQLAMFERNYKEELDPLYAEIHELKAKRKVLQDEKTAARGRLRRAKDNIETWHYDSSHKYAGDRLSKHQGSGQSFGDLDWYKQERAFAVQELQQCTQEIDRIKLRVEEITQEIDQVKYARQQMFELKEQGIHPAKIKRTLANLEYRASALQDSINTLEQRQSQFLKQARYQCGAVVLDTQIQNVKVRQAEFIASFDDPAAKEARQHTHRELWLKAHGAKTP